MAVAAFEGRAYLYMLKSMHEMRAEFKEKSHLGPIKEVSTPSVQLVPHSSIDEASL